MNIITLQVWLKNEDQIPERIITDHFPVSQSNLALKQLLQWYNTPNFVYGDVIEEPIELIYTDANKKFHHTKIITTLEYNEVQKYNSLLAKLSSKTKIQKLISIVKGEHFHVG
jgi:hypothetical protein